MAKIKSAVLLAECKRISERNNGFAARNWDAEDSAIAALRATLQIMGREELLKPSVGLDGKPTTEKVDGKDVPVDLNLAKRKACLEALKPLFTAPINFQRNYLVDEKLAPEKAAAAASNASEYV